MSNEGSKRAIILTIRSYQTMLILLLFYTYENNRKSSLTEKLDNLKTFFKTEQHFLVSNHNQLQKSALYFVFIYLQIQNQRKIGQKQSKMAILAQNPSF